MRRSLACLCSCLMITATAINFAQTADAAVASPGTVTIAYDPQQMTYSISPGSISGTVGDTFTLADTLTSGNSSALYSVSIQNDTGSVSLGGTSCTVNTSCQVLDLFAGTASGVYTIAGAGVVKVWRNYQSSWTQLGTLTIGSGGSSSSGSTPTHYTFTYLRADGVECGAISPATVNAGSVTLPASDANCTTPGFAISGWVPRGSATALAPGSVVTASGDQTFTAQLTGSTFPIQYDSNLEIMKQCSSSSGALSPSRSSALPNVTFSESPLYSALVYADPSLAAGQPPVVFAPRTARQSNSGDNGRVNQNLLSAVQVQAQYEQAAQSLRPSIGPQGPKGPQGTTESEDFFIPMTMAAGVADLIIDGVNRQQTVIASRDAVTLRTTAPCTPADKRLVGWSTDGTGTGSFYLPGAVIPADQLSDVTGLHLYAIWGNASTDTANAKAQALIADITKNTAGMDANAKAQYVTEKLMAYATQPDAELWLIIWIASSVSIINLLLIVFMWIKAQKKNSDSVSVYDSSSAIRQ